MEMVHPSWKGVSIISRKGTDRKKYMTMLGPKSILYIPIEAQQNSTYRIILELKKESGTGRLGCNIYGNRNFDFRHSVIDCKNNQWDTYFTEVETKDFPNTVPLVFRLFRPDGGTGNVSIRRIVVELASSETSYEPEAEEFNFKNYGKQKKVVRNPISSFLTNQLVQNNITHKMMLLLDSNSYDIKNSVKELGMDVDTVALSDKSTIFKTIGAPYTWAHLHISNSSNLSKEVLEYIKNAFRKNAKSIVSGWFQHGISIDSDFVILSKYFNFMLFEDIDDLEKYKSMGGTVNSEIWNPGVDFEEFEILDDRQELVKKSDFDFLELRDSCPKKHHEFFSIKKVDYDELDNELLNSVVGVICPSTISDRVAFSIIASGAAIIVNGKINDNVHIPAGEWLREFNNSNDLSKTLTSLLKKPSKFDDGIFKEVKALGSKKAKVRALLSKLHLIKYNLKESYDYSADRILCISDIFKGQSKNVLHNGKAFLGISSISFEKIMEAVCVFQPDVLLAISENNDGIAWSNILPAIRYRFPNLLIAASSKDDNMDFSFKLTHMTDNIISFSKGRLSAEYRDNGVANAIDYYVDLDNFDLLPEKICEFSGYLKDEQNRYGAGTKNCPDMSIFVGTFNRLASLKNSIKSFINASAGVQFEIIINDAGSTDGTIEWIKRMAKADNRIKPIFSGKRTSFTQAFNESLQVANGKYICWMSDDIITEGSAIQDMFFLMEKSSVSDMGGFPISNPGDDGFQIRKDGKYFSPTVGCVHTETMRKYCGLNMDYPYYSQDAELCIRILRLGGKIACLPPPMGRLKHLMKSDELRRDNMDKHNNLIGNGKYLFMSETYREHKNWPFPLVLLDIKSKSKAHIKKVVAELLSSYSLSHLFIGNDEHKELFPFMPVKLSNMNQKDFEIVVEINDKGVVLKKYGNKGSMWVKQFVSSMFK